MRYLIALSAAFRQQWWHTAKSITSVSFLIAVVPQVAAIAWIANQSDDPIVVAYISIGGPLLAVWSGVIYRIGWSLSGEMFGGRWNSR